MRIWALILILLSCVVGFVFSYGFAYKKVSGVLYSTAGSAQAPASSFLIER
jgi:hypothetical protein